MRKIVLVHENDNLDLIEVVKSNFVLRGYEVRSYGESPLDYESFVVQIAAYADAVVFVITSEQRPVVPLGLQEKPTLLSQSWEVFWHMYNSRPYPSSFVTIPVSFGAGFGLMPPVLDGKVRYYRPGQVLNAVEDISNFITAFVAKRDEDKREVLERIESNLSKFVDDAIMSLKVRESRDFRIGFFLSISGIALLLLVLCSTWVSVGVIQQFQDLSPGVMLFVSVKYGLLIVLCLVACKYSFTLGKSYTHEAIRTADRIHAIEFGRFYLRAFGESVTGAEVREVFSNWNVSAQSSFSAIDSSSFDPKLEERFTEIAKAVLEKVKG